MQQLKNYKSLIRLNIKNQKGRKKISQPDISEIEIVHIASTLIVLCNFRVEDYMCIHNKRKEKLDLIR